MKRLKLTERERAALYDAAEVCISYVEAGRIWQNESPELLRALRRGLRKLWRMEGGQVL